MKPCKKNCRYMQPNGCHHPGRKNQNGPIVVSKKWIKFKTWYLKTNKIIDVCSKEVQFEYMNWLIYETV